MRGKGRRGRNNKEYIVDIYYVHMEYGVGIESYFTGEIGILWLPKLCTVRSSTVQSCQPTPAHTSS
jgi:hypothetical protein